MTFASDNERWMQQALLRAECAQAQGEVPVGAIVVFDNQIIAEGWNQPITQCDPTAHAEMLALRQAASHLANYRLAPRTSLYITLEPCAMCAGAMLLARVQKVVFGAYDPRAGAAGSVFNIFQNKQINHKVDCIGGVLEQECGSMLRNFFKARRAST